MNNKYKDDCPEYVLEFLFYLKVVKGRGERTVEAYYIDIRTFLRYLKLINNLVDKETPFEKISIKDVPIDILKKFTLNDAYEYLYYTSNDRANSTATRARKTSALKQLFSYLHKKAGLLSSNPLTELEIPGIKHKLPKFLSLEDSIELLSSVSGTDSERNYCILTLFLNCGMRLSELVGINIGDINFEARTLKLLGKGNKERIVYLNDACIDALNTYLKVRKSTPKQPNALFLSKQYSRISKRRVQQIVEESLKVAGLSQTGVTTHKLRHTAATLMYQHGNVDPLVLKEVLGHKSIATTEIYTHLSNENIKNAAESSPLANVKKITKSPKKQKDDN